MGWEVQVMFSSDNKLNFMHHGTNEVRKEKGNNNSGSAFERSWKNIAGEEDHISLANIYTLLGSIESSINITQGFLTKDLIFASKVNSLILQKEKEHNKPAGKIFILKSDMACLVKQLSQHLKVIDISSHEYGEPHNYYRYYDEIDHDVNLRRSRIPIINSNLSEPEYSSDDNADTFSLVDNINNRKFSSSPTSFLDSEPGEVIPLSRNRLSSGPQTKEKKLIIGDLLYELNEFHEQINLRFESFEYQINNLERQNQNDLNILHTISTNNYGIISRVESLQKELNTLNQEFKLIMGETEEPNDDKIITQDINDNNEKKTLNILDANISINPISTTQGNIESHELLFYSIIFLSVAIVYKIISSYV